MFGEAVALCRLRDCPEEKRDKMIRETLGISSEQDRSEVERERRILA